MLKKSICLSLLLTLTLLFTTGCYRKEVRRRAWPGFSVQSNATAAPRAQAPNMPDLTPKQSPVDAVLNPIGDAFRGVGRLFAPADDGYTGPQPDGQPRRAKPDNADETLFPPPNPNGATPSRQN